MLRWKVAGPPILSSLLLLAVWQAIVAAGHVPAWILPGPLAVLKELAAGWPRIWMHTASTLQIALIGFAAGTAAGVALAVMLHVIPGFRAAFYPLLVLSQNVPIIVLAPLLIVWLGFGLLPKIVVVVLVCFFPVAVAMLSGFVQTDLAMLDYMRMIGATRMQIFLKVEFPYSLPYLFSGLKISTTYCIMGAVVAEWLGAEKGIGQYLLISEKNFMTTRVFVAIFMIVLLSLLLFGLVQWAESRTVRWRSKGGR